MAVSAEESLPSASLAKLFTTYATLNVLGPDHVLSTIAYVDSNHLKNGVISAPLIIKGYGDPFMVSERLWMFAQKIKAFGIRSIQKGIVVDQGYFTDYPTFELKDQVANHGTVEPYLAGLSPTALNFNAITFGFFPSMEAKDKLYAALLPESDFFRLEEKFTPSSRHEWHVAQKPPRKGKNPAKNSVTYVISGRIQKGRLSYGYKAVPDATSYFGYTLIRMLEGLGVSVEGGVIERSEKTALESGAYKKIEFDSLPMSDLVKSVNKYSNNFMADMLVFAMGSGHEKGVPIASYAKGRARILSWLEGAGINHFPKSFAVGSGLSRNNLARASTLLSLLRHAWKNTSVGPELFSSLAISGADGTLKARKRLPPLRAKSGSLSGISNLAGIVQGKSGKSYFVVFMMSNPKHTLSDLQHQQDGFLYDLAAKL